MIDYSKRFYKFLSKGCRYGQKASCYDQIASEAGKTVDHDWSHVVFGASTDYKLAENTYLTPGMYFQKSMDDSVNKSNEFWVKLGVKYLF